MDTSSYIPLGKLGAHRQGDKLFQVQTEFAHRPRPRITSTVTVDGRTVHKTDHDWADDLAMEENRSKLELALEEQHRATMGMVAAHAGELTADVGPAPVSGDEAYAPATFRDTMEEILRSVGYTMAFYEFDETGEIVHRRLFRDVVAEWDREFAALSAIVFGLPQVIRVGEFKHGVVHFGAENLISARIRGRAFGIITDPAATVDQLREDFPELFEAVYHAPDPV